MSFGLLPLRPMCGILNTSEASARNQGAYVLPDIRAGTGVFIGPENQRGGLDVLQSLGRNLKRPGVAVAEGIVKHICQCFLTFRICIYSIANLNEFIGYTVRRCHEPLQPFSNRFSSRIVNGFHGPLPQQLPTFRGPLLDSPGIETNARCCVQNQLAETIGIVQSEPQTDPTTERFSLYVRFFDSKSIQQINDLVGISRNRSLVVRRLSRIAMP